MVDKVAEIQAAGDELLRALDEAAITASIDRDRFHRAVVKLSAADAVRLAAIVRATQRDAA